MTELALIVIAAALVNNLVLVQSLGVYPMFGASERVDGAIGVAIATGVLLVTAAVLAHAAERYVLAPLDLPYLRLIAFVAAIGVATAGANALTRHASPRLRQRLGLDGPLVTANCVALGVALLNSAASRSLVAALFYAIGAALGFGLAVVLFAGLRERVAQADVPEPFRGPAILFVTAGILSLAFLGFAGFARL
ncbi:MAG TPA: Rnf-Nqr domain containing protein [Gammaproteobacteria bacterium]|jgi:electron transport complex protein RnfA|nr:Rnf-Nqr domain containing protein [Gammaproteobacteria bacterium]